MLNKQLVGLLAAKLQHIIVDLNEEQLQMSIWSGNIVLRDIKLQPTFLEDLIKPFFSIACDSSTDSSHSSDPSISALLLPFTVVNSVVSECRLTIPWTNLSSEPVLVELNGGHITLGPLRARPYTSSEEVARTEALKQVQLNRFEAKLSSLFHSSSFHQKTENKEGASDSSANENAKLPHSPPGSSSARAYFEQLVQKVIRNTRLELSNFHFSYELDYLGLHPSLSSAISLWLKEAYITTTDECFEDRFVYDLTVPVSKKVEALGVSVVVCSGKRGNDIGVEESLSFSDGVNQQNHLLFWQKKYHFCGELVKIEDFTIKANFGSSVLGVPQKQVYSIDLGTENQFSISYGMIIALWDMAYSLLNGLDSTSNRKYFFLLNDASSHSQAAKRWNFAISCIIDQVRKKSNKKSRRDFVVLGFGELRRQYCSLYKRWLGVSWLLPPSDEEVKDMKACERTLPLDTLLFFRSVARAEADVEEASIALQKSYVDLVAQRVSGNGRRWQFNRMVPWFKKRGEEAKLTGSTPPIESSSQSGDFHNSFCNYWKVGEEILKKGFVPLKLKPNNAVSSSLPEENDQKKNTSIEFEALIGQIRFVLLPHFWRLGTLFSPSHTYSTNMFYPSFLERVKQRFTLEFDGVHLNGSKKRLEEPLSFKVNISIGSVLAYFSGLCPIPFLCSSPSDLKDQKDKWLLISCSDSNHLVDISLTKTVVFPSFELQCWYAEVLAGKNLLYRVIEREMGQWDLVSSEIEVSGINNKRRLFPLWKITISRCSIIISYLNMSDGNILNISNSTEGPTEPSSSLLVQPIERVSEDGADLFGNSNWAWENFAYFTISLPINFVEVLIDLSEEDGSDTAKHSLQRISGCSFHFEDSLCVFLCTGSQNNASRSSTLLEVSSLRFDVLQEKIIFFERVYVNFEPSAIAFLKDLLLKPLEVEGSIPKELANKGFLHYHRWECNDFLDGIIEESKGINVRWDAAVFSKYMLAMCTYYYSTSFDGVIAEKWVTGNEKNRTDTRSPSSPLVVKVNEIEFVFSNAFNGFVGKLSVKGALDKKKIASFTSSNHAMLSSQNEKLSFLLSFHPENKEIVGMMATVVFESFRDNKPIVEARDIFYKSTGDCVSTTSVSTVHISLVESTLDAIESLVNVASVALPVQVKDGDNLSKKDVETTHRLSIEHLFFDFLLQSSRVSGGIPSNISSQFGKVNLKLSHFSSGIIECTSEMDVLMMSKIDLKNEIQYPLFICDSQQSKLMLLLTKNEMLTNFKIDFRGGKLVLYFPFLFELPQVLYDPFYVQILSLFEKFVAGGKLNPLPQESAINDLFTTQPSRGESSSLKIEGWIHKMELYLATNSLVPVNMDATETYFPFHLGKTLLAFEVEENKAQSFSQASIDIEGISYFSYYNPLALTLLVPHFHLEWLQKVVAMKISSFLKVKALSKDKLPIVLALGEEGFSRFLSLVVFNWLSSLSVSEYVPETIYDQFVIENSVSPIGVEILDGKGHAVHVFFTYGISYLFRNLSAKINLGNVELWLLQKRSDSEEILEAGLNTENGSHLLATMTSLSIVLHYPDFIQSLGSSGAEANICRVEMVKLFYYPSVLASYLPLARSISSSYAQAELKNTGIKKSIVLPYSVQAANQLPFEMQIPTTAISFFDANKPSQRFANLVVNLFSATLCWDKNTFIAIQFTLEEISFCLLSLVDVKAANVLCALSRMSLNLTKTQNVKEEKAIENTLLEFDVDGDVKGLLLNLSLEDYYRVEQYIGRNTALIGANDNSASSFTSVTYIPHRLTLRFHDTEISYVLRSQRAFSLRVSDLIVSHRSVTVVELIVWKKEVEAKRDVSSLAECKKKSCLFCLSLHPEIELTGLKLQCSTGKGICYLPEFLVAFDVPFASTMQSERSQLDIFSGFFDSNKATAEETLASRFIKASSQNKNDLLPVLLQYYRLSFKPGSSTIFSDLFCCEFYSFLSECETELRGTDFNVGEPKEPSSVAPVAKEKFISHIAIDLVTNSTEMVFCSQRHTLSSENGALSTRILTIRVPQMCTFSFCWCSPTFFSGSFQVCGGLEVLDGTGSCIAFAVPTLASKGNDELQEDRDGSSISAPLLITFSENNDSLCVSCTLFGLRFQWSKDTFTLLEKIQKSYDDFLQTFRLYSSNTLKSSTAEATTKKVLFCVIGHQFSCMFSSGAVLEIDKVKYSSKCGDCSSNLHTQSAALSHNVHVSDVALRHSERNVKYGEISSAEIKYEDGAISIFVQHVMITHLEAYARLLKKMLDDAKHFVGAKKSVSEEVKSMSNDTIKGHSFRLSVYSIEVNILREATSGISLSREYLRIRLPALSLICEVVPKATVWKFDCQKIMSDFIVQARSSLESSQVFSVLTKGEISIDCESSEAAEQQLWVVKCNHFPLTLPSGSLLMSCAAAALAQYMAIITEIKEDWGTMNEDTSILCRSNEKKYEGGMLQQTTLPNVDIQVYLSLKKLSFSILPSHDHLKNGFSESLCSLQIEDASLRWNRAQMNESLSVEVKSISSTVEKQLGTPHSFLVVEGTQEAGTTDGTVAALLRVERKVSEVLPTHKDLTHSTVHVSTFARLNHFIFNVSSQLLDVIHLEVLSQVREAYLKAIKEAQIEREEKNRTVLARLPFYLKESTYIEGNDLVVSGDICLPAALIVGGSGDLSLRFKKYSNGKIRKNVIKMTTNGGGKLVLLPNQRPTIIVDEGVVVNVEVPVYIKALSFDSVVSLGERSIFKIKSSEVFFLEENNQFAKAQECLVKEVDIAGNFTLSFHSLADSIMLSLSAAIQYHDKIISGDGEQHQIIHVDERGNMDVKGISLKSQQRSMMEEDLSFLVNLEPPREDWSKIAQIKSVLPPIKLYVTPSQISVVASIFKGILRCLEDLRIGSAPSLSPRNISHFLSHSLPSKPASTAASDCQCLLELHAECSSLSIILLKNGAEVELSLEGLRAQVKGERNGSSVQMELKANVALKDLQPYSLPRILAAFSPCASVCYSRFSDSDSSSLEITISSPKINVTIPLFSLYSMNFSSIHDEDNNNTVEIKNFLGESLFFLLSSQRKTLSIGVDKSAKIEWDALQNSTIYFCRPKESSSEDTNPKGNAETVGNQLDVAKLRRNKVLRISTSNSVYLLPLRDVVFRCSDDHIITISTPVKLVNAFHDFAVRLPGGTFYAPGESGYVSLADLTSPLSELCIGDFSLNFREDCILSLETVLSAFLFFPPSAFRHLYDRPHSMGAATILSDDTMKVHLKLHRKEASSQLRNSTNEAIICSMVIERKAFLEPVSRAGLVAQHELQLLFEAGCVITNLTGGTLIVNNNGSVFENHAAGQVVKHYETFSFFPDLEKVSDFNKFQVFFHLENLAPEGSTLTATLNIGSIPSHTTRILPLISCNSRNTGFALFIDHKQPGNITLRAVGIVHNRLSCPVRLIFTRGSVSSADFVLSPGTQMPINVPFQADSLGLSTEEPIFMRLRSIDSDANDDWSSVFLVNSPSLPTNLIVRSTSFLTQIVASSNFSKAPELPLVELHPKWSVKNCLPLTLEAKINFLDSSEILEIAPGGTCQILKLPLKKSGNPELQIRVARAGCPWTLPVMLVSLGSLEADVQWKYSIPRSAVQAISETGVTVFEANRVPTHPDLPMECEQFLNLSIFPQQEAGAQCVLHIRTLPVLPLIVENQTNIPLQIQELAPLSRSSLYGGPCSTWGYFSSPCSDTALSWDQLASAPSPIRIDLLGTAQKHSLTLNRLNDLAASEEAKKIGSDFFVVVRLQKESNTFFITISENVPANRLLVPIPSTSISFAQFSFESLSLYVAAPWGAKTIEPFGKEYFLSLAQGGTLHFFNSLAESSTGKLSSTEIIELFSSIELDLIWISVVGGSVLLSRNGKHIQGSLSVGRVEVVDCTSPNPVYPSVLIVNSLPRDEDLLQSTSSVPLSAGLQHSMHFSWHLFLPQKTVAFPPVSDSDPPSSIWTIWIEKFIGRIGAAEILLHDNFLFILQSAFKRMVEIKSVRVVSPELNSTPPHVTRKSASSRDVYNCCLRKADLSSIELRLTVTRRADGLLNPFQDYSSGALVMVPSVEGAPLILPSVHVEEHRVQSPQLLSLFSDILLSRYKKSIFLQLFKLIGSLSILGNPLGLVSGWGRGLHAFLAETAALDPLKGAQSFLKEASSSTLHSVGVLSHFGSRVASKITLDGEWVQHESESALPNRRMLMRGLKNGVVDGIGGVFQKPIIGTKNSGVEGFVSGLAGGMTGLVSRTVSGALRSVGDTAHFVAEQIEAPSTPSSLVDVYLKEKRNFVVNHSSAGHLAVEEKILRSFSNRKEFLTREQFNDLFPHSALFHLSNEEAQNLAASIGIHNIALHCDTDFLFSHWSREEFLPWEVVMKIGCCTRFLTKYFEDILEKSSEHKVSKKEKFEKQPDQCSTERFDAHGCNDARSTGSPLTSAASDLTLIQFKQLILGEL